MLTAACSQSAAPSSDGATGGTVETEVVPTPSSGVIETPAPELADDLAGFPTPTGSILTYADESGATWDSPLSFAESEAFYEGQAGEWVFFSQISVFTTSRFKAKSKTGIVGLLTVVERGDSSLISLQRGAVIDFENEEPLPFPTPETYSPPNQLPATIPSILVPSDSTLQYSVSSGAYTYAAWLTPAGFSEVVAAYQKTRASSLQEDIQATNNSALLQTDTAIVILEKQPNGTRIIIQVRNP